MKINKKKKIARRNFLQVNREAVFFRKKKKEN